MKTDSQRKRLQEEIPTCPKCGTSHPEWTFAGKANSGKAMIRCSVCHHRITVDYGKLTHYSHQGQNQWKQLIEDTENMHTINETAEKLGVSKITVIRMRSRLHSHK